MFAFEGMFLLKTCVFTLKYKQTGHGRNGIGNDNDTSSLPEQLKQLSVFFKQMLYTNIEKKKSILEQLAYLQYLFETFLKKHVFIY